MTLTETATIIKKIVYSYPYAFKHLDLETVIRIWHEEMQHYEYHSSMRATRDFINSSKFPPTIADICVYKELHPAERESY